MPGWKKRELESSWPAAEKLTKKTSSENSAEYNREIWEVLNENSEQQLDDEYNDIINNLSNIKDLIEWGLDYFWGEYPGLKKSIVKKDEKGQDYIIINGKKFTKRDKWINWRCYREEALGKVAESEPLITIWKWENWKFTTYKEFNIFWKEPEIPKTKSSYPSEDSADRFFS